MKGKKRIFFLISFKKEKIISEGKINYFSKEAPSLFTIINLCIPREKKKIVRKTKLKNFFKQIRQPK